MILKWSVFLMSFSSLAMAEYGVFKLSKVNSVQKCEQIAKAYPRGVVHVEANNVILANGRVLPCKNKVAYNLENRGDYLKQLDNVSVADVLSQEYPSAYSAPIKESNYSPGRIRNDQLFINTYLNIGNLSDKALEVSRKDTFNTDDIKVLKSYLATEIETISFLGFHIPMNKRNGAAAALQRVGERLHDEHNELAGWLRKNREMSGGYNLRMISGTERFSAHSWGIAVDLTIKFATENLNFNDSYWKWVSKCVAPLECVAARSKKGAATVRSSALEEQLEVYIVDKHFDHFAKEVIQVFAEEGFIWGGHWNHFDTMHFEYRPEFFEIKETN